MSELKKLYIAEDNDSLAQLMLLALSKTNLYEITMFSNGLDLYQKAQTDPPDLIVSDIILPKLDGLAVARLLKFHDNYRHIGFIVTSSMIEPNIEKKVKSTGADLFIRKPFKLNELRDNIQELLNR